MSSDNMNVDTFRDEDQNIIAKNEDIENRSEDEARNDDVNDPPQSPKVENLPNGQDVADTPSKKQAIDIPKEAMSDALYIDTMLRKTMAFPIKSITLEISLGESKRSVKVDVALPMKCTSFVASGTF